MSERTAWLRTDPNNPYCLNCGMTWDMHLADGRTSCPRPALPKDTETVSEITDNEPSVAELVEHLNAWKGQPKLLKAADALTRLERRCAEMEKRIVTAADLEWIRISIDGAATALPVLFTMCTKVGLREGATVADEINGDIITAKRELARILSRLSLPPERANEGKTDAT